MLKPNIKDLSRQELEEWLAERKESSFRASQIQKWLFQRGAASFSEMTNLSAGLRRVLEEEFSISRLAVLRSQLAQDGTAKFLFGLADGLSIGSVLIPDGERLTLCISSQAGCGFGCVFCATARLGLKRNLRASEMVDQILEARRSLSQETRVTHVVFMGMGEPLANYAETVAALRLLSDTEIGIGISPRRITVSTVGLVPQVQTLMEETRVNLAISLHAATESLRSKLMPVNRKYGVQELIECCRSLPLPRRRRITFEYVLLQGINDSPEDARSLCRLLNGIRCKINLIPFNPFPDSPFARPVREQIEQFEVPLRAKGFQVNIREARGDDIQAACGQLHGESRLGERAAPLSAAI